MTGTHAVAPGRDGPADVCSSCGKLVRLDVERNQVVTIIGGNAECYGAPYPGWKLPEPWEAP
jgi:hypothetical protein